MGIPFPNRAWHGQGRPGGHPPIRQVGGGRYRDQQGPGAQGCARGHGNEAGEECGTWCERLSLLGAPRRVTQSPEFLSKLESGVGAGIAPEASPRAARLLVAGDIGDRQDRAQEGGPAPGKRTEGRGPFTPRTEWSAAAGLTDTGQALVPGHRASRETYHPAVPRTEGASKKMGLPT